MSDDEDDDDIYEKIDYVDDNKDNNNNIHNNNNNNNIQDEYIYRLDTYVNNNNSEENNDDDDDDNNVNNNNNDFLSQLKILTTEDNEIYRIINYVDNKHNKNKNINKNKNENEILQLIYRIVDAIEYIIDNIKLELKTNINEENITKDKLAHETLSNEKNIKLKHILEVIKEKKIVFENDLMVINKLKNNNILEYTGRYI
jgi:hypothetical protein